VAGTWEKTHKVSQILAFLAYKQILAFLLKALTVLGMTTRNPNPDPIQTLRDTIEHRERVVSTLKTVSLNVLKFVVLGVLAPTWLLNRFGYDLDIITVWVVWVLSVMLLMVYAGLLAGLDADARKAVDESRKNETAIKRLSRQYALRILVAVVLMLVFGALEFNVGFGHILLAYLAPSGLRDLVAAAVRRIRGNSNALTAAGLEI
jgi:hypothetical protein